MKRKLIKRNKRKLSHEFKLWKDFLNRFDCKIENMHLKRIGFIRETGLKGFIYKAKKGL